MKYAFLMILSVVLGGCVSISKEAMAIQIQRQDSNLIANCQQVGPVSGQNSTFLDGNLNEDRAIMDMRENAVGRGDTIVLLNVERFGRQAQAQGVIYNCYNRQTAKDLKPKSDSAQPKDP